MKAKILGKILFVVYILFLLYFLIFSDWYGRGNVMEEYHYNLVPFREIKRFWEYRSKLGVWSFVNLFGNVLVFVPFGFFESMASKYRNFWGIVVDGFLLSMIVEVFQLLSKVGRLDVDDLLLNTVGVIIGYVLFLLCDTVRRKYGEERKRTQEK